MSGAENIGREAFLEKFQGSEVYTPEELANRFGEAWGSKDPLTESAWLKITLREAGGYTEEELANACGQSGNAVILRAMRERDGA